jgi:hypothetical protein
MLLLEQIEHHCIRLSNVNFVPSDQKPLPKRLLISYSAILPKDIIVFSTKIYMSHG